MVVEVTADAEGPSNHVARSVFEDRMILVRAADEDEAFAKGKAFAADYEQTVPWLVRKIVDVHEVVDAELLDGVEGYSAFIGQDWADVLMKGVVSPVGEWKRQHPGKDVGQATVQEIIEAWNDLAEQP